MNQKNAYLKIFLVLALILSCFCGTALAQKATKMSEKQTLVGLDKEYSRGELIKIKVSPLPGSANTITAIYKFSLLENGKVSQNCEQLTKSEKNTDTKKATSDFIFTARCDPNTRYQVLFMVTYIETKTGTSEIVEVVSPDPVIHDVKISGTVPEPLPDPTVPDGKFGMIRVIYLESQKLTLSPSVKKALFEEMRNTFSGLSSKIAAGVYKDSSIEQEQVDRINGFLTDSGNATTEAFKKVNLPKETFDGNIDVAIKGKLQELFDKGFLRKFNDYQVVYAEIAEGFDLAARTIK